MRHDTSAEHGQQERASFLLFFSIVGILGCASLLLGTIIAPFYVPNYNWVSDTISDLGAGNSERIMDFSLYGFAAGLFATALAAAHAHLGKIGWSVGVFSLAILGALVVIVGARNEYGDHDHDGVVIHQYLVYGLGVFFLLAPSCMAGGLHAHHPRLTWTLIALAIVWAITAPIYFMLPTSIDGLFERGLGIVACAIIGTLCFVFIKRGLHRVTADQ